MLILLKIVKDYDGDKERTSLVGLQIWPDSAALGSPSFLRYHSARFDGDDDNPDKKGKIKRSFKS